MPADALDIRRLSFAHTWFADLIVNASWRPVGELAPRLSGPNCS